MSVKELGNEETEIQGKKSTNKKREKHDSWGPAFIVQW